ncbi:MAG: class I SAM-dependent methyltransferase [Planctomycetota bacterium]|jgi:hypothetical protein
MKIANLKELYGNNGIYAKSIEYGAPIVSRGLRYSVWANRALQDVKTVLCIGCGIGYDVVYWLKQGKDAYGTEMHSIDCDILRGRIINCVAPGLPFKDKEFDLVMCTEVIEHILPETTEDFIKDCCRISNFCFLSMATTMDSFGTHINYRPAMEWLSLLEGMESKVLNFQSCPLIVFDEQVNNYPDGVCAFIKNI